MKVGSGRVAACRLVMQFAWQMRTKVVTARVAVSTNGYVGAWMDWKGETPLLANPAQLVARKPGGWRTPNMASSAPPC